jgi:hypothetical protein
VEEALRATFFECADLEWAARSFDGFFQTRSAETIDRAADAPGLLFGL